MEASDEALYRAEDLRPSRFGLKWPRLSALKRIGGMRARSRQHAGTSEIEKDQILRYLKLMGLTALALVILLKPWLIPLVLFMLVWLALIVFLLLGSARISELSEGAWIWYQSKCPERA